MAEIISLESLPDILTTKELARALRCSKAHVCNLLNGVVPGMPSLPYLPLGRKRVVRKAALIQWINQIESEAGVWQTRRRPRCSSADAWKGNHA